jgi:hypothetical protein
MSKVESRKSKVIVLASFLTPIHFNSPKFILKVKIYLIRESIFQEKTAAKTSRDFGFLKPSRWKE